MVVFLCCFVGGIFGAVRRAFLCVGRWSGAGWFLGGLRAGFFGVWVLLCVCWVLVLLSWWFRSLFVRALACVFVLIVCARLSGSSALGLFGVVGVLVVVGVVPSFVALLRFCFFSLWGSWFVPRGFVGVLGVVVWVGVAGALGTLWLCFFVRVFLVAVVQSVFLGSLVLSWLFWGLFCLLCLLCWCCLRWFVGAGLGVGGFVVLCCGRVLGFWCGVRVRCGVCVAGVVGGGCVCVGCGCCWLFMFGGCLGRVGSAVAS